MRLYAIRHGETSTNRSGLDCGRSESPLTELGRYQIAQTVRHLAGVQFSAAYASPRDRTIESYHIISSRIIHLPQDPQVDDRLAEMDFGSFEMTPNGEWLTYAKETAGREDCDWKDVVMPGGESLAQVETRVATFIDDMRARHEGEDVLAIAHGGSIVSALITRTDYTQKDFPDIFPSNGALTVVDFSEIPGAPIAINRKPPISYGRTPHAVRRVVRPQ